MNGSTPKYYLNDTGIMKLFSQTAKLGHLAENAVFLHLLRQTIGEQQIHYDLIEDQEIDFVIGDHHYEVNTKPIEKA